MTVPVKTRLFFRRNPPWSKSWDSDCLLIFDRVLLRHRESARWVRRFPHRYGVKAGETLKDVNALPGHLRRIARLAEGMANRRMTVVVAGGGSVGDFGGFVASVFKRGVRLVHVPTTWLSAIDSAHGGKTGLNLAGAKNQIGTFYPASEVHLVRAFLVSQSEERAVEAAGEFLKTVLLKGGTLARLPWKANDPTESFWRALPALIRAKMSVVEKDPREISGHRHLLNLGHTMGHVFESELRLPHGMAVGYGLVFAAAFSRWSGICSAVAYEKLTRHPLWSLFLPSPTYLKALSLSPARVRKLLLKDKKRSRQDRVRFVFVKAMGKPVIREISANDLVNEMLRQRRMLRSLYG